MQEVAYQPLRIRSVRIFPEPSLVEARPLHLQQSGLGFSKYYTCELANRRSYVKASVNVSLLQFICHKIVSE